MKEIFKQIGVKGTILAVVILIPASGAGAIIFERFVLPQLQAIPVLRDLNIFDPRSPIVIIKREEIRIDGGVNIQEVISRTRGSLARVYVSEGPLSALRPMIILSGMIATNDGLVITPTFTLKPGANISVVLENGDARPGQMLFMDTISGLAFLKISAANLPVLNEAAPRDITAGDRFLALALEAGQSVAVKEILLGSTASVRPSFSVLYDLKTLDSFLDVYPGMTESDLGSVIVDQDAALVGFVVRLKDAPAILRIDGLELALDNFLGSGSTQAVWPELRTTYLFLGSVEAGLLELPQRSGVLVRQGEKNLLPGDFVYEIDGREITEQASFGRQLLEKKPGQRVKLQLFRQGEDIEIEVVL